MTLFGYLCYIDGLQTQRNSSSSSCFQFCYYKGLSYDTGLDTFYLNPDMVLILASVLVSWVAITEFTISKCIHFHL